jgi:hypothetical protein
VKACDSLACDGEVVGIVGCYCRNWLVIVEWFRASL